MEFLIHQSQDSVWGILWLNFLWFQSETEVAVARPGGWLYIDQLVGYQFVVV